jgi:hypothetical protein
VKFSRIKQCPPPYPVAKGAWLPFRSVAGHPGTCEADLGSGLRAQLRLQICCVGCNSHPRPWSRLLLQSAPNVHRALHPKNQQLGQETEHSWDPAVPSVITLSPLPSQIDSVKRTGFYHYVRSAPRTRLYYRQTDRDTVHTEW